MRSPARPRTQAGPLLLMVLLLVVSCGGDDGEPGDTAEPGARGAGAATIASGGAPWTQYGSDLANSGFDPDESIVTTDSVGSLTEIWSLHDLLGVTSTPTVVDGVAYVGDWSGSIRALELATGDEVWITEVGGSVAGSVAVGADGIFASTSTELYRLDPDTGAVVWETTVHDHPIAMASASPVVADGLVLQAVASGELMIPRDEYTFRGALAAYDAESGEERWRFWTTPGDADGGPGVGVWSTPAVDLDRGLLYVGTGNNYDEPPSELANSILAIDYRTGELAWSTQFTFPDIWSVGNPDGDDADVGAGPNLWSVGDRDLVGAGDKAGTYYALDRDSGEVVWEAELTQGSALGGVQASAAFVDGRLVVASNVGDPVTNSPTNTAMVLSLDPATGDLLWERELDDALVFAAVSAVPGVAFVGTTSGTMVALDAATGDQRWRHQAPAQIGGAPAIADGIVVWGYGFTLFDGPGEGGLIAFAPSER